MDSVKLVQLNSHEITLFRTTHNIFRFCFFQKNVLGTKIKSITKFDPLDILPYTKTDRAMQECKRNIICIIRASNLVHPTPRHCTQVMHDVCRNIINL